MKTVNYTEADVAVLATEYVGADNKAELAALAAKLGKSENSVRAKLSNMGLYKTVAVTSKAKTVSKRTVAEQIGDIVGLQEFEVDGLEKATKTPLDKVLAALVLKNSVE